MGADDEQVNLSLTKNEVIAQAEETSADGTSTDGTNLAGVLNIKKIYYDYNSSGIRTDAEVELEKIVVAMKKYNTMKIEIRAYADSRGEASYNQRLSNKRAAAVVTYLVNRGINSSRLKSKGFGETQLLNDCGDNTPCTEAQHQINRRTEFIVIAK